MSRYRRLTSSMHKNMANLISAAFCCLLLSSACGQDNATTAPETAAPWVLDGDRIEDTSYKIESCRDDFQTGPVWEEIEDQRATLGEPEWIAILGTTREFEPARDFSERMRQLRDVLDAKQLELLENHEDRALVVAGKPADILGVIRSSCLISGFDMTGFHCVCAKEQCLAARSCAFERTPWVQPFEDKGTGFDRIIPGYAPVISCGNDVNRDFIDDIIIYRTGFRGVKWIIARELYSWENSTCPTDEAYFEY